MMRITRYNTNKIKLDLPIKHTIYELINWKLHCSHIIPITLFTDNLLIILLFDVVIIAATNQHTRNAHLNNLSNTMNAATGNECKDTTITWFSSIKPTSTGES